MTSSGKAVNGSAAGAGAAFAYACDLRIAATSASFSMAFAGVGLGPDSGASWTLQRLVGYGKAMELMLLGNKVDSGEALRLGHNYVGTEHILLALLEAEGDDGVLTALGVDKATVERDIATTLARLAADLAAQA